MCSGQFSITSLNGLIFGRSAGYNQKLSGVLNSFKYALELSNEFVVEIFGKYLRRKSYLVKLQTYHHK